MDIHDFLIILREVEVINELSQKCSEEDLIKVSNSLDKESRKKAVVYLKRVSAALSDINCKGFCKTKFKLAFPELFVLIRKAKFAVTQ